MDEPLTPDELQDLVTAAVASSALEAAYLSDTLDEAGIPTATRNDNTMGLGGNAMAVRVCVPRLKLTEAQALIDTARKEAQQRGVEGAFEPESVADDADNVEKDPVLKGMFLLRNDNMEERCLKLEPQIVEWMTEGMASVKMAKYLGAAGLTLEEAEALLREVNRKHAQSIKERRNTMFFFGVVLIVVGVIAFFMMFTAGMRGRSAIVAVVTGLAMTFFATRPLPTIEKTPTEDKK